MTNLQEYLNQRLSADILNQYKNKSTQELVSDIVENPKAKTAREAMEAIVDNGLFYPSVSAAASEVFAAEERQRFALSVHDNPQVLEDQIAKYGKIDDPRYPDRKGLSQKEITDFRKEMTELANLDEANKALEAAFHSPHLTPEERLYFAFRDASDKNPNATVADAFSMGSPVFSKTDKHPVNAQATFDAVELERLQKAIKASEAATNVPEPAQPGQLGSLEPGLAGSKESVPTLTR